MYGYLCAMKLLSWNVNGIRSVAQKGFLPWIESQAPDIFCLQEVKCQTEQLTEDLLNPLGYKSFWHCAKKKGYSGVATYTKREPLDVRYGLGVSEIDDEGRVLILDFKGFSVINTYFPNSRRDHSRLPHKLQFCQRIQKFLEKERASGKNLILCGDFNIAHKEIDLKNPKTNRDNAGFLPEERAWLDAFLKLGYVDTFREFNQDPGHYTWWSFRPGVREKNIGWRLDYFVVNQEFRDRLKTAAHQPLIRGSDHCPVELRLRT
jgi:exodeoxyribonuclease III